MTRSNFISALLASVALAFPAAAMTAQSPITAGQVAVALDSVGMNTTAEQVVVPDDVVAKTSAPALKVESMEFWGDRQLKVRLGCVNPGECLPFFVAVRGSKAQPVLAAVADRPPAANLPVKSDSTSFTLMAGSRATLLLEGDHVHIQVPVVCLQNGAVGQTIRVASPDHKQTYVAQVMGNNVLRGRLQ